jgi:hypothetical protein
MEPKLPSGATPVRNENRELDWVKRPFAGLGGISPSQAGPRHEVCELQGYR